MIIHNYYTYGEYIFKIGKLKTKQFSRQELTAVAVYMLNNNYTKGEIRYKFDELSDGVLCYLDVKDKTEIYNRFIASATRIKDYNVKVPVYECELENIRSVKNWEYEKVLFALLVHKKWIDTCHMEKYHVDDYLSSEKYWYWFHILAVDLKQLADVTNFNTDKYFKCLNDLIGKGMLNYDIRTVDRGTKQTLHVDKLDMFKVNILNLDTTKPVAFWVENFNNLGKQYYAHYKLVKNLKECPVCHHLFEAYKNKQFCSQTCKKVLLSSSES